MKLGDLSAFTCPECHGALVRFSEGPLVRFRCHVGHAFTASTLLSGIAESVQPKLWQASRALEELVMLLEHMACYLETHGRPEQATAFRGQAHETAARAQALKALTAGKILSQEMLDAAAGIPLPTRSHPAQTI